MPGLDALLDVLRGDFYDRPSAVEIMVSTLTQMGDDRCDASALADMLCLSFDTLYGIYQAELSRKRKVYGYDRLSADMKRAVGYQCEKCGCKEDGYLPNPPSDAPGQWKMVRQDRTVRLTLHFLSRNRNDWTPVNIMVLCTTCAAEAQLSKAELYKVEQAHKSIDNQVDAQIKKKARPKADKPETRKQKVERQRTESGQQSFI